MSKSSRGLMAERTLSVRKESTGIIAIPNTTEFERRKEQTTAGRKALTLIRFRNDYGYTSYLEVVVHKSNLFEAELQESFLIRQKLNACVSLYRAPGGGWDLYILKTVI